MIYSESNVRSMGRDWKETGDHGKVHTEEQHRKRKSSGRWKYCHMRYKIIKKGRWNKKKGIYEYSKKHSKKDIWMWCN